jgi:aldose 1-epimerase
MQYIDDADFQIRIDDDQGANIASVVWREMEFALPFRGSPLNYGWYGLSPWAGRIRDGLITSPTTGEHQLPTNLMPPHAIHGFGFVSSWQEIGPGRSLLHLPKPYGSATVEQKVEVLDDAIRWSLEYDPGDCDLPAWLGFHPWFPRELDRGGLLELEFSAEKMLKRDDEGIATSELITPGPQPWDDAFTGIRGTPALVWDGAARIDIESDAPWWVVYTEDSDAICVEPQTAPPDAANLGYRGEHYLEALFIFSAS